jgi:gliding motility-associated-like protein
MSTTPSGSIVGWDWSFGDTGTSITDDPLHTYTASGTFNATLIVESSLGCFDTIQQSVTVNPLPVPSFTNTVACENGEIFFTDNSFISSGSINAWEYLFEQGNISNQQNPSYTYTASGTYSVEFTATSALGCEATVFQNVVVNPSPTAAFTINPNPALALEDVNFIDASTGNQLSNWYWNFGDGEGDNNQNSIHNYSTGGVYPITLIVTDINGCQDTTKANLSIALLPVLPTGFTPNEDGENDVFIIRGGPFKTVDFKIYNNWGQLIYESTDALEGWNGMYKGERAPMGVYTWTFTVEMTNGQVVKKSGDVTLMR